MRAKEWFERFLTGWMETTSAWMNADSRLLRASGLALGILGIITMYPLLALWLLVGKKPK